MKLKKLFFYVLFILSLVIVIVPIFFEVFRSIYLNLEIINYKNCYSCLDKIKKENIRSFLYFNKNKDFLEKFLTDSRGIVGYIYIPNFNVNYAIYREKEKKRYLLNFERSGFDFYCWGEDRLCLKFKKTDSFEKFVRVFQKLNKNDKIYVDILGEKKVFSLIGKKILSLYEEEIPFGFEYKNLTIILDFPFSCRSYCLGIKAEKVSGEEFEEAKNLFSILIDDRYILTIVFLFSLVIIFIGIKLIIKRRKTVRKNIYRTINLF